MNREDNILTPVALEIILNAGNAREKSEEAIKYAHIGDFKNAYLYLEKAKKMMLSAHHAQTEIIQKETQGESFYLDLLFIHAQDTLMTIRSELNLRKEIIGLYEFIHNITNKSQ
ncbi:PTS lactose/cellobiose transporter subunit IIA [Xenorhabdus ishibashii]|uniref:PTS lactose/cellobiose transporter subunit IIA n=1 Tax=Xenorhabdus ishibashii TaxID=1034471 RepID=A0A2D0KID5_9GAMM|nr:PTS lactose/cellobiose transporter subunit IIA [Xenorhabdus ishibashii]PHM63152.1 PTS lactose/cellobiose transporter subunit IIA [Xenorhabdus ishibashii]